MAKYKIEHDRENCIGCGACADVCPKFWSMESDGKSKLIGATKRDSDGWFELEIDEADFECNKNAADGCPAGVIHVKKLKE